MSAVLASFLRYELILCAKMENKLTTRETGQDSEDVLAVQNIISDLEESPRNVQYDSLRVEEAHPIEKISEEKARIKCESGEYTVNVDELPYNGAVFENDSFLSKLRDYDTFYVTLCDISLTSTSDTFILRTTLYDTIIDKLEFFEKYATSEGRVRISKERESKQYDIGFEARKYAPVATEALASFLTLFFAFAPFLAAINGYLPLQLAMYLMFGSSLVWMPPAVMMRWSCSYRGRPIDSIEITDTDNDSSEWKVVSGTINWEKEENILTIAASSGEKWRYNTSPVGELQGEAANVFSHIDVISTDSVILHLEKVPPECTGARRTNTNGEWIIRDVEL